MVAQFSANQQGISTGLFMSSGFRVQFIKWNIFSGFVFTFMKIYQGKKCLNMCEKTQ